MLTGYYSQIDGACGASGNEPNPPSRSRGGWVFCFVADWSLLADQDASPVGGVPRLVWLLIFRLLPGSRFLNRFYFSNRSGLSSFDICSDFMLPGVATYSPVLIRFSTAFPRILLTIAMID